MAGRQVFGATRALLRSLIAPALAFALGLGLSAAFFIPALVEQGYINRTQWFGEYYNPEQHFVYFHQLFDPRWGFGISQPGPDDAAQGSLSYQLGAVATLFSLIALALSGRYGQAARRTALLGAVAGRRSFPDAARPRSLWRYAPSLGSRSSPGAT